MQRTGTIAVFDDPRGIGECIDETGRRYPFHCTAIVDGTRTIEVGTAVRFGVRAGSRGVWEAVDVERA